MLQLSQSATLDVSRAFAPLGCPDRGRYELTALGDLSGFLTGRTIALPHFVRISQERHYHCKSVNDWFVWIVQVTEVLVGDVILPSNPFLAPELQGQNSGCLVQPGFVIVADFLTRFPVNSERQRG